MSLESELQARLLLVAPERLPTLRLFRRNVGTANMYGRKVHFGVAGQCDLYGYTRQGRVVEIELKAAGQYLKPDQKIWQKWCIEWGVPHIVLTGRKDESATETAERWCQELEVLLGL